MYGWKVLALRTDHTVTCPVKLNARGVLGFTYDTSAGRNGFGGAECLSILLRGGSLAAGRLRGVGAAPLPGRVRLLARGREDGPRGCGPWRQPSGGFRPQRLVPRPGRLLDTPCGPHFTCLCHLHGLRESCGVRRNTGHCSVPWNRADAVLASRSLRPLSSLTTQMVPISLQRLSWCFKMLACYIPRSVTLQP